MEIDKQCREFLKNQLEQKQLQKNLALINKAESFELRLTKQHINVVQKDLKDINKKVTLSLEDIWVQNKDRIDLKKANARIALANRFRMRGRRKSAPELRQSKQQGFPGRREMFPQNGQRPMSQPQTKKSGYFKHGYQGIPTNMNYMGDESSSNSDLDNINRHSDKRRVAFQLANANENQLQPSGQQKNIVSNNRSSSVVNFRDGKKHTVSLPEINRPATVADPIYAAKHMNSHAVAKTPIIGPNNKQHVARSTAQTAAYKKRNNVFQQHLPNMSSSNRNKFIKRSVNGLQTSKNKTSTIKVNNESVDSIDSDTDSASSDEEVDIATAHIDMTKLQLGVNDLDGKTFQIDKVF